MKLSKVERIINTFEIEDISNYRIDKLDENRVPNSHVSRNGTTKKCQVSLMLETGEIKALPVGKSTVNYLQDDDVLGVHVEFHHLDHTETKTLKYEQMILVK